MCDNSCFIYRIELCSCCFFIKRFHFFFNVNFKLIVSFQKSHSFFLYKIAFLGIKITDVKHEMFQSNLQQSNTFSKKTL
jgi:hypothetical protein